MSAIEQHHLSGINFDWVIVREIRFVDNPQYTSRPKLRDLRADISVDTHVADDKSWCGVLLRLTLHPPAEQPDTFQVLAVVLEARFSLASETPTVDLTQFSKVQAPAILMPFVREEIAAATAKSRFGQLLLPPLNVVALMQESDREQPKLEAASER